MGGALGQNAVTRDDGKFVIKSFDVYVDDDTNPTFYAEGEKTLSFGAEFAEFVEGVPSSLVRKDLTSFSMGLSFMIKDFGARAIELARGGEYLDDGTYDYVYFGTDYQEATTHKYTFVGETVDAKSFEFVLLKGAISEMPDLTVGGGDYSSIPVVLQALKDSTESDESRNLGYFKFEQ
jgi:hypothetical protein